MMTRNRGNQRQQRLVRPTQMLCQKLQDLRLVQMRLGHLPMAPWSGRAVLQSVAKREADLAQIVHRNQQTK